MEQRRVEPNPTFWSKLIRELRHEKRWSQRKLAQLAKVNRTTLRSIEDGMGPVKMDVLERLLEALGHELVALPRESLLDRLRRQAAEESDPDRRSRLAARILLQMEPD